MPGYFCGNLPIKETNSLSSGADLNFFRPKLDDCRMLNKRKSRGYAHSVFTPALLLAIGLQTSCVAQTPGTPDPQIAAMVAAQPFWSDDFTAPTTATNWERGFAPVANAIGDRILPTGEVQVYTDTPYLNRDLLALSTHKASLVATPMNSDDRKAIDARMASANIAVTQPVLAAALSKATWVSTLLKGRTAFEYGYFEANIRQDSDPSAWGGIWLLPQARAWPPEIDIAEILSKSGTSVAHQTLHWLPQTGPAAQATSQTTLTTPGYHTYGVLWRPDWIMFFVDRQRTACFATPADMHQPMYPLLNLAIGGWAAAPSSTTAEKITMDVTYVHYWSLPNSLTLYNSICPNIS